MLLRFLLRHTRTVRVIRFVRVAAGTAAMVAVLPMRSGGQTATVTDTAHAVRLGETVRLDGRLTESVWQSAPAITRFTQREPNEGAPAIENTEVRIAYDDDALYVGARMFSRNPSDIRALVTRRDQEGISEFVAISLDTYLDRRTAYSFGITPAGVRIDVFHPADNDDSDSGYDPVWEARAHVDSLGWTAEMRIPFNQLRFSPREQHVWGLNVLRRVPARNEDSYWRLIRRDETGWASRMGLLVGIAGIAPSRRVELLPYVAGGSRLRDVTDPANPFQHATESEMRAGGDLKVGIGPNLTLDVTLNPDFGQVEGDPAVVNLSAFEVFFDEKRPFFTEGSDLLDRRGMFYSRRIGGPPPGDAGDAYAEARSNTTILGAAKMTGRLPSKLAIAGLAAVTDREVVRTFDPVSATFGRAEVAPRSLYGALAAQQEFGRDASTIAGMVTLVQRALHDGSPLAAQVPSGAIGGLLDGRFRWARGTYDVNYFIGGTSVAGDSLAILRQQLSSRRYWQRPDARRFRLDSSLTSLRGAFLGVGHSKMAGKHWLWDLDYTQESPGFEPNDIGAFGNVDNRYLSGRLVWRETTPTAWYRSYATGAVVENGWSFDWLRRFRTYVGFFEATLPSFWEINADAWAFPRSWSDRLTRGGPVMRTSAGHGASVNIESRDGARTGIELGARGETSGNGSWEYGGEIDLSFRPGSQLELVIEPEWGRSRDTRQFIGTRTGGSPATFGTRYIFSAVDVSEVSATLRANYTFTPNLSLETYAEPFAASGRFHSFGELAAARSGDLRIYGTDTESSVTRNPDGSITVTDGPESFTLDGEDFNVRSFRSNVVLRWEWRLGSTLFLVWQQDRSGDRAFRTARPGDLLDALDTRGDNFLALKVTYWMALR